MPGTERSWPSVPAGGRSGEPSSMPSGRFGSDSRWPSLPGFWPPSDQPGRGASSSTGFAIEGRSTGSGSTTSSPCSSWTRRATSSGRFPARYCRRRTGCAAGTKSRRPSAPTWLTGRGLAGRARGRLGRALDALTDSVPSGASPAAPRFSVFTASHLSLVRGGECVPCMLSSRRAPCRSAADRTFPFPALFWGKRLDWPFCLQSSRGFVI